MKLKGVIFDLDGTLVDSRLDFDLMRLELGIVGRKPVLEFVESQPEGEFKQKCWDILLRHEFKGAEIATVIAGIPELLAKLELAGLHLGILTRNMREPTRMSLDRLGLKGFSKVFTREDGPAKPDPRGIHEICAHWGCRSSEVIFVGDFRFDLLTGKNAGTKTVLYACGELPPYAAEADHVTQDFNEFSVRFDEVLAELGFEPLSSD